MNNQNDDLFDRFEALTFDDVVIVPGYSETLPDTVDTRKPGTKASTPTARPMTRCATGTEARAPRIPVPMTSPAMAAP